MRKYTDCVIVPMGKKQVKCCKHGDKDYSVYLLPEESQIARGEDVVDALKSAATALGIHEFEVDLSGIRHKHMNIPRPSCEIEVELDNARAIKVNDFVVGPCIAFKLDKNVLYKCTVVTQRTITFQDVETNESKSSMIAGKDGIAPQVWKVLSQVCNASGWTKIDDLCFVSNAAKGQKKEVTVLFLRVDLQVGDIYAYKIMVWTGYLRQYTSAPDMAHKAFEYATTNPAATASEEICFHYPEEVEKYYDMPSGILAHLSMGNEETFYLFRSLKAIFLAHVDRFGRSWLSPEEMSEILAEASPRSGFSIDDILNVYEMRAYQLSSCGVNKVDDEWVIDSSMLIKWFAKADKHQASVYREFARDLHSNIYSSTLPSNITDLENIYDTMTGAGFSIGLIEAALDRLEITRVVKFETRSGKFNIDLYALARIIWDPDLPGPDIGASEPESSFIASAIANVAVSSMPATHPRFLRVRVRSPGKMLWEPLIKKDGSYTIATGSDKKAARFRTLDIGEVHMPEKEGIVGIAFVRGVPCREKPARKGTVETDDWKTQAIVCESRVLSLPDQYSDEILIGKFLAKYKSTITKFLQREFDEKIEDIKIVAKGADHVIEFKTNKTGGDYYDDCMLLDFLLAMQEKGVAKVEAKDLAGTNSMTLKSRNETVFEIIKNALHSFEQHVEDEQACKTLVANFGNALQLFVKTKYPILGHLVIRLMDLLEEKWKGVSENVSQNYSVATVQKLIAFSQTVPDEMALVFRNVLLEFLRESTLYVMNLQPYLEAELKSASSMKPAPSLDELAERLVTLGVQKTVTMAKKLLQHQLKTGTAIEREHTTDTKVARQIALQHLEEHWDYYIKLQAVEQGETDEQKALGHKPALANLATSGHDDSVKGFVWSNVDGDVVVYTPKDLLDYISTGDSEDSLRGLLESDDSAIAHVGLMQMVKGKPKPADLEKYSDSREGFLEALKDIKEDHVNKGQFLEINDEVIEAYEKEMASYNLWTALPGYSDIFGFSDFEKPNDDKDDEDTDADEDDENPYEKHLKAVVAKLKSYLSTAGMDKPGNSGKNLSNCITPKRNKDSMFLIKLANMLKLFDEITTKTDDVDAALQEFKKAAKKLGIKTREINSFVENFTETAKSRFSKSRMKLANVTTPGMDAVVDIFLAESNDVGEAIAQMQGAELDSDDEGIKFMEAIIEAMQKQKDATDFIEFGKRVVQKLIQKGLLKADQETLVSQFNEKYPKRRPPVKAMATLLNQMIVSKSEPPESLQSAKTKDAKDAKGKHVLDMIEQISQSTDRIRTEQLESEISEELGEKLLGDTSIQTVLYDPEGADLREKIASKFHFPVSVFDEIDQDSRNESILGDVLDYAKERVDDYISILGKKHEHSITGTIGNALALYNRLKKQFDEGNPIENDVNELIEFVIYEIDYALENGMEDEELEDLQKKIDSYKPYKKANVAINENFGILDEDTIAGILNYEKDRFERMGDDAYGNLITYIKDRVLGQRYKRFLSRYATRQDAIELYKSVREQYEKNALNQDDLDALLELVKWDIDFVYDSGMKNERLLRMRKRIELRKLHKIRSRLRMRAWKKSRLNLANITCTFSETWDRFRLPVVSEENEPGEGFSLVNKILWIRNSPGKPDTLQVIRLLIDDTRMEADHNPMSNDWWLVEAYWEIEQFELEASKFTPYTMDFGDPIKKYDSDTLEDKINEARAKKFSSDARKRVRSMLKSLGIIYDAEIDGLLGFDVGNLPDSSDDDEDDDENDSNGGSEKDKKIAANISPARREAMQNLYNEISAETNSLDEATSEFEKRAKKEGFTSFEIGLFIENPENPDEDDKEDVDVGDEGNEDSRANLSISGKTMGNAPLHVQIYHEREVESRDDDEMQDFSHHGDITIMGDKNRFAAMYPEEKIQVDLRLCQGDSSELDRVLMMSKKDLLALVARIIKGFYINSYDSIIDVEMSIPAKDVDKLLLQETATPTSKVNLSMANLIGVKDDWISNLLAFAFSAPVKSKFGNFGDSKSRSDFLYMLVHAIDNTLSEEDKLKNHNFLVGIEKYDFNLISGYETLYSKAEDDKKHANRPDPMFIDTVNDILEHVVNKIKFKDLPVTKVVGVFIEMCKDERGIVIPIEEVTQVFPYAVHLANLSEKQESMPEDYYIRLRKIVNPDDAVAWLKQYTGSQSEDEEKEEEDEADDRELDFSKVMRSIRFNSLDEMIGFWDEEHEEWEIPSNVNLQDSPFNEAGKLHKGWKKAQLNIIAIIDGRRSDESVPGYTFGNYALVKDADYKKVAY